MNASKTATLSIRVSPQFKELLRLAALQEQRSQTNLLEKLLTDHCSRAGLKLAPGQGNAVAPA